MTIKEMQKLYMDKALKKYKTVTEAAKVLGISSRTLHTHIKSKKKDESLGNGL